MTRSPVNDERHRWHQSPEWSGTAPRPPQRPLPSNKVRSGIDEAIRARAYRASHADRLLYNPFARRK